MLQASLQKKIESDPIHEAGQKILDEARNLQSILTPLSVKDEEDLKESLKLATAVIDDPKNEKAILELKIHALNVAKGKPDKWKQLRGALMILAGVAIMSLSVAGIPFSGGTSLGSMYLASTLITAGGGYTFFQGRQFTGMAQKLVYLADQVKSKKPK